MSDARLEDTNEDMEPDAGGQESRVPPLQTAVDRESRQEITTALVEFGFDSAAEGMRLVLKAFARSPLVRDAVRSSLHLAVLDASVAESEPAT